jgi:hypothetical protein
MYTKEQIIDEIKRITEKLGVTALKERDFKKHSGISINTVKEHFDSWNDAVEEATPKPPPMDDGIKVGESVSDEELLLELLRLYERFGREPNTSMVNAEGRFSDRPYVSRWGDLGKAFLFAKEKYPERIKLILKKREEARKAKVPKPKPPSTSVKTTAKKPEPTPSPTSKPEETKKTRTVLGEPIDFRSLRFAPVNKLGVIYLFAMISYELGFLIDSIKTEFPHCEGKRCFDKENNQWENIRIEFEYKSSDFKTHGYDDNDCDMIVCWTHDWKECALEVLELRTTIEQLKNSNAQ